MGRGKKYQPEQVVNLLRQIEVAVANGKSTEQACREAGISYSQFMHGLKLADIGLDRKVLAEVAMDDPAAFMLIIEQAKSVLAAAAAKP